MNNQNQYETSKFLKLSYNLKPIIFLFLPLEDNISTFFCSKSFLSAFKQTKFYHVIKSGNFSKIFTNLKNINDEYFTETIKNSFDYLENYLEFKTFFARILNKIFGKTETLMLTKTDLESVNSAELIGESLERNKKFQGNSFNRF